MQLIGIVGVVPMAAWLAYWLTTGGHPRFAEEEKRVVGYMMLTFLGVFFGPWIALGATRAPARRVRARSGARSSTSSAASSSARRRTRGCACCRRRSQPHFLFNTLANVQALVDAGSPQASDVLRSLIAYLRAAVPRLHEPATTLGQELELVRAYLELMHMRMPDRLQFALHVDEAARALRCPPMTLLTLVENAVRHGIDPSEEGGRIDDRRVSGAATAASCASATPASDCEPTGDGLGTGLSTLRERLQLAFGGDAQLRVERAASRAACAPSSSFPRARSRAHDAARPTALIADDEPLLREALARHARARPGPSSRSSRRRATAARPSSTSRRCEPDVCFLDVHMPGLSGVEAARHIGRRAHLVFVTAYDHYAVQAFAQGVLDYLVKPVEPARLAETVARLKERLRAAQPALEHRGAAAAARGAARSAARRDAGAAALDPRAGRQTRAPDPGRRRRLPALRRRSTRWSPGATTPASPAKRSSARR